MMLLNPDFSQSATFATGLGMVKRNDSFGGAVNTSFTRRLIGFVKNNGAIRWGITTAPQPLPLAGSADLPRRLPVTLAPNPVAVGTSPTVQFTLNRAQAVALTVCDAVGRVVAATAPAALAAGPQRLPVPGTAALTPGVYHVRLTLADGRQTHLRLVHE